MPAPGPLVAPAQPPIQRRAPSPRKLKLISKSSPLFTPARKERIADQMEASYRYLLKVGFDAPTEVPPIGTRKNHAYTST